MGGYTSLPWDDLCAQVLKLRIALRGVREVSTLPVAVGASPRAEDPRVVLIPKAHAVPSEDGEGSPDPGGGRRPRPGGRPALNLPGDSLSAVAFSP